MESKAQLIVGTAGHIDHGKSRLVWALTGTNPDRLPEEQARGMTIDLGFAHVAIDGCDIWFVDVPGHERFIRNMVAGATGVDVAMLVVAADDSIMPQTREHAELLALLGFDRCLVVLTKMDLVDEDWAAAVEDEVRQLLESVGITAMRFVRTSAESRRGFDELRGCLTELARVRGSGEAVAGEAGPRWFRLPVDRAFNVAGRGAVATGSVYHGAVQAEDELELWPNGMRVRVRGLQSHSEGRDAAAGRMRLAINLAGVSLEDLRRGCELATPEYLEATRCLEVRLAWLRMPGKLVRRTLRLRLHIATSEVLAQLRLADEPAGDSLRGVFGQLLTGEPIVAAWGQRFVVRDETGTRTLGGGRVMRPAARPWSAKKPPQREGLRMLHEGKPKQRLEEVIRACEWRVCGERQLATRAGLADGETAAGLCRQLGVENRIVGLAGGGVAGGSGRMYLHAGLVQSVAELLVERLARHLATNSRLPGLARGEWLSWMPRACPQRVRAALADWLIERGYVVAVGAHVVPKGHHAAMSEEDQALFAAIVAEIHAAAFQPPGQESLKCATRENAKRVRELIELAAARGRLVRIADGMWLAQERFAELARTLNEALRAGGELTVAAVRDRIGSSRTYVVPILEYTDSIGLTRRVGDVRKLGARAEAVLATVVDRTRY
jgi:selenocysteine-specific elongation factor